MVETQIPEPLKQVLYDHERESNLVAEVLALDDNRRDCVHQELLDAGIALPMQHQPSWERAFNISSGYLVLLRDEVGRPVYAFSARFSRSRALPGQRLLRVSHYGATHSADAAATGIAALAKLASRQKHLLRVYLEVLSANQKVRQSIAQSALAHGFVRQHPQRTGYAHTLMIDLSRSSEAIFQGFSRSARRNILAPEKRSLTIRPVTLELYADRMSALLQETLDRTGGVQQGFDWRRIIDYSNTYPALSRISGCFDDTISGPDALLSYAWGCHHGNYATHAVAASTRVPGSNLPLSYATAWDLIQWARINGAQWFDFGGVTLSPPEQENSLAGISSFKRFFTSNEVDVGEEWTLEPSLLKAKMARLVGKTAQWVSTIGRIR